MAPEPPRAETPWNAAGIAVPDPARAVPTMLSAEEGRLLYWLARDRLQGLGAVCDLGCFLGGSTARLAAGIAGSGRDTPVHAYDHFTIHEPQKRRHLAPAGIALDGTDMLPLARQFLAPWPFVHLHRRDIRRQRWDGGAIELLFIDAGKSPESADAIARTFMPHLVPGHAIVLQQDYQHWRQPWIPAQMELLADCLELCGWCAQGTVLFRATRAIGEADLDRARVEGLDDAALTALIARAIGRFPHRPQRVKLARAIMALEDNPGVRAPQAMKSDAFAPQRVKEILAATGRA